MCKENKKEPVWKKYVKKYAGQNKQTKESKKSGFDHKDVTPVVNYDPYDAKLTADSIELPNGFKLLFKYHENRLFEVVAYHEDFGLTNRPVEEVYPELKDVQDAVYMDADNRYVDRILRKFEAIDDNERERIVKKIFKQE